MPVDDDENSKRRLWISDFIRIRDTDGFHVKLLREFPTGDLNIFRDVSPKDKTRNLISGRNLHEMDSTTIPQFWPKCRVPEMGVDEK